MGRTNGGFPLCLLDKRSPSVALLEERAYIMRSPKILSSLGVAANTWEARLNNKRSTNE